MSNFVPTIVMGLTAGVIAWGVSTRWPRDWKRLIVAEALVCAAVGAVLAVLVRG